MGFRTRVYLAGGAGWDRGRVWVAGRAAAESGERATAKMSQAEAKIAEAAKVGARVGAEGRGFQHVLGRSMLELTVRMLFFAGFDAED